MPAPAGLIEAYASTYKRHIKKVNVMYFPRVAKLLLPLSLLPIHYSFAASDSNATTKSRPASPHHATPRSKLSYTYAGIEYINQHLDSGSGCNQDGLQLYGSLYIKEGWFAEASFGDVSGSICGSSRVTAGGGYKTAFNNQFDMYGTLKFETISPDGGGSDSGLLLTGGLRGFLTKEIESVFELTHSTAFDGSTAIRAGGRYWFDNGVAATADIGFSSDYTIFEIGARVIF